MMQTSSARVRQPYTEGPPQRRDYSRGRNVQRPVQRKKSAAASRKKRKQDAAKKNQTYSRIKSGSKSMPGVFKRGNIFFVVERGQQYRPSKNLLISLAVIFCCALMVVLANAQITGAETQIAQANRRLRTVSDENFALEAQMRRHYTTDQIEYIAFMRLGMRHPDPAQIIEINVPRQNHVMFNTAEDILPQESHFWSDLRIFFNGILDRLIGG